MCCPGYGDLLQCGGPGSISSRAALGETGPFEEEQCHPHWSSPLHDTKEKQTYITHQDYNITYCCILKVALQQPFNINSKDKHLPCSLGLSTCSAVLLLPFTVAPIVGAIQAVLALESSVAEGLTLQLELLLSMSLEEKGVRELECLHRTDSRSDFSGGLSTMVIIHFLWKNRRQLNHF